MRAFDNQLSHQIHVMSGDGLRKGQLLSKDWRNADLIGVDVHVRRLLSAGYKVGLVKQMETAALKKVCNTESEPA